MPGIVLAWLLGHAVALELPALSCLSWHVKHPRLTQVQQVGGTIRREHVYELERLQMLQD